jgi:hypothetical protein
VVTPWWPPGHRQHIRERPRLTPYLKHLRVGPKSVDLAGRIVDPPPTGGWHVHFHGADDTLATGSIAGCATALAPAMGSDMAGRLGACVPGPRMISSG